MKEPLSFNRLPLAQRGKQALVELKKKPEPGLLYPLQLVRLVLEDRAPIPGGAQRPGRPAGGAGRSGWPTGSQGVEPADGEPGTQGALRPAAGQSGTVGAGRTPGATAARQPDHAEPYSRLGACRTCRLTI